MAPNAGSGDATLRRPSRSRALAAPVARAARAKTGRLRRNRAERRASFGMSCPTCVDAGAGPGVRQRHPRRRRSLRDDGNTVSRRRLRRDVRLAVREQDFACPKLGRRLRVHRRVRRRQDQRRRNVCDDGNATPRRRLRRELHASSRDGRARSSACTASRPRAETAALRAPRRVTTATSSPNDGCDASCQRSEGLCVRSETRTATSATCHRNAATARRKATSSVTTAISDPVRRLLTDLHQ